MRLSRFSALKASGIVTNRTTLARWIDQQGFPKPIPLGPNTVAWNQDEVDAWVKARAAERDGAPPEAA